MGKSAVRVATALAEDLPCNDKEVMDQEGKKVRKEVRSTGTTRTIPMTGRYVEMDKTDKEGVAANIFPAGIRCCCGNLSAKVKFKVWI